MAALRTDAELVAGLHGGDEGVFADLLDSWSRSMLRVAREYVSTDASAEEVVQDTWVAVITGIDRFEQRSSLRTWVFRILVNIAKKRGVREHRTIPVPAVAGEDEGPTVDGAWFQGPEADYPGHWRSFPARWAQTAEQGALSEELRETVRAAVDLLPPRQRTVITLRDVLDHSSDEVCAMLDISAGNQRVLLHRARAVVRAELAGYLADEAPGGGLP